MIKRILFSLLSLFTVIILSAGAIPTALADTDDCTASASPAIVSAGQNQSITLTLSGGLTAGAKYYVRLYRAYEGYESGLGSSGINFDAGYIGSKTTVTANSDGGLSSVQSQHIAGITNVGVYAYAIMEDWDTVARVFFEVTHTVTEKGTELETAENSASLTHSVISLGEEAPVTLNVTGGLEADKTYRCRIYSANDGYTSGLGNTGVNYKGIYYNANSLTADSGGAGSVVQTVHSSITAPGIYAYTVMDDTNSWHTVARAFFTVTESSAYAKGDLNLDGGVNVKDLVRMKKMLSGKADLRSDTDLNGDRAVNTLDITALRGYLVGIRESVYDQGVLNSSVPDTYKSSQMEKAREMRDSVQCAQDTVKATGTTYYISPDGDDSNNGTSKSTPWKSLARLKQQISFLKTGDAVLFERGGIYRTVSSVKLVSGVSYGAYGTGDKPCIYGSAKNYAKSRWVNVGENLWQINEGPYGNVGIMVFDYGEETGYFRFSADELSANYDFCSGDGYVTLYLDRNPSEVFESIEMSNAVRLFDMPAYSSDIVIENICFKYTGGHAVRGSNCSDITVRGLEIGYVGGSILTGYGDGTTRYGNGVEFMNESKNILVENNWIYQIYDSGVTHQGGGEYHLNGFTVRNNLIEYCGMGSVEYWHTADCDISDVTYENNLMRFAGYGFGGRQRPDKELTGHIMSNGKPTGAGYNKATNFVIKNNIFELSSNQLINATSAAGTPPVLGGNTYIQWQDGLLGYYENNTNIAFDGSAADVLKSVWGDTSATVIYAK